jgi:hypothetical protein
MRLVSTIIILLAVSVQSSIAQVTYEADETLSKSKKNQVDKEKKKKKSSNWISLSSGFSQKLEISNWYYNYKYRFLISELNYSHRHFLNTNNFLSYQGGIFFRKMMMDKNNQQSYTGLLSLSFSGRILYNYHFNGVSINTGFGMSLIGFDFYSSSLRRYIIGARRDYFGIIGLNIKLNKNNELGIRTNYQLFRFPSDLNDNGGLIGGYVNGIRTLIFQLKFNHRLTQKNVYTGDLKK